MEIFEEYQLRAYINEISNTYDLGITISEKDIVVGDGYLHFKGRLARSRSEREFVATFHTRHLGVLNFNSILVGSGRARMTWFPCGSASRNCKSIYHKENGGISLHASKSQMRENISKRGRVPSSETERAELMTYHENTYNYYMEKGFYEDDISIGRLVDEGGDYLTLKLTPLKLNDGSNYIIGNLPSFI